MGKPHSVKSSGAKGVPQVKTLWLLASMGIVAWAVHLFASYALVEWYCQPGDVGRLLSGSMLSLLLMLLTVLCCGVALLGAFLSRHRLKTVERGYRRARFMLSAGLLLGLFLAMAILLQGWPLFFLSPCQGGYG